MAAASLRPNRGVRQYLLSSFSSASEPFYAEMLNLRLPLSFERAWLRTGDKLVTELLHRRSPSLLNISDGRL